MAWTMSVALRESCDQGGSMRDAWTGRWLKATLTRAQRIIAGGRGDDVASPSADRRAARHHMRAATKAQQPRTTVASAHVAAPSTGPISLPDPDQLAARISHDLRTPLNAVLGFSELMQIETKDRDPNCRYRKYAAHIQQSGEALRKATEETLAFTQMITAAARTDAPPKRGNVSIAAVIETVLEVEPNSVVLDPATMTDLRTKAPQVEGCEAAFREAFARLIRSFNAAAPNATQRMTIEAVDDQILVSLQTPADVAAATPPKSANGAPEPNTDLSPFPLTTDTLDLFIVQTVFALQGAKMSWVTGQAGQQLTARILIPLAAQWSLPLERHAV